MRAIIPARLWHRRGRVAEKSIAIAEACAALKSGARDQAISLLKHDYPFVPRPTVKRHR
jgi:hypothetical protein